MLCQEQVVFHRRRLRVEAGFLERPRCEARIRRWLGDCQRLALSPRACWEQPSARCARSLDLFGERTIA